MIKGPFSSTVGFRKNRQNGLKRLFFRFKVKNPYFGVTVALHTGGFWALDEKGLFHKIFIKKSEKINFFAKKISFLRKSDEYFARSFSTNRQKVAKRGLFDQK